MANATAVEEVQFIDLFEGLGEPKEELAPDVASEDVALTDEQRGALAARDRLAERVGADSKQIGVVMEDIATRLMEGGVIVDLDIHRWTGMKRLLPKELGLNGKRTRSKAIQLGEKLLMPPTVLKIINSLTTQLRAHLDSHSIRTVWGRWVPATAYQKWRQRHDQLVEEYLEVGNSLADNVSQIKQGTGGTWGELYRLYSEHARVVYCRLNHQPVDDFYLERCPAWFVDEYVDGILSHVPDADEIRRSFQVETKVSYIPLPSMLAEDRVRQNRLWEKAADEREADRRRREAKEAMEADVRAHYLTQKREMVDNFLGNIAEEVYSQIYDVSSRALTTMAKNQGKLLEPTLRQLRGLVQWAGMMNVADDQELATAIADLETMITRSTTLRAPTDVQEQLKAMGTIARSVLVDLDVNPTIKDAKLSIAERDAILGIGKRLSRATVAQAREQLGTADVPELLVVQARRGQRAPMVQTITKL